MLFNNMSVVLTRLFLIISFTAVDLSLGMCIRYDGNIRSIPKRESRQDNDSTHACKGDST